MVLLNPNMAATFPPPVMEARRWLDGAVFTQSQPLINVSQAAPVDPPPSDLRREMARAVLEDDDAHLYGPVLGLPALRDALAENWAAHYAADVSAAQIAITSGCNQAFAASLATLAAPGDEIILPTPWYFNHKMWLDMGGISTVPLPCGAGLVPSVTDAKALITSKTRAIVLVSPNNPSGSEYPADVMKEFYDLCAARGLALIVDETYKDFDSRLGAPHSLLQQEDWDETLIQLYSFSKSYRLTGHRVGAMIASPSRLAEAEKFLDTVTICPNQLGQRAALWGLQNLGEWLAEQRAEILTRRQAIDDGFSVMMDRGWELLGSGAYFAYLTHPYAMPSNEVAQKMVSEIGVLALPGTMFTPDQDPLGPRSMRIAFANVDSDGIAALYERLARLKL